MWSLPSRSSTPPTPDATRQRNTALALRAAPIALSLSAEDPRTAAFLALAAYRLHQSPETEGALIATVGSLEALLLEDSIMTVSDDGTMLAFADPHTGTTTLFSITDGGLRKESSFPYDGTGTELPPSPKTSPDGRILLSPAGNGDYTVWDISDRHAPIKKGTLPSAWRIVDWSPDSRHTLIMDLPMAADPQQHVSRVWNVGDTAKPGPVASLPGAHPLRGHHRPPPSDEPPAEHPQTTPSCCTN